MFSKSPEPIKETNTRLFPHIHTHSFVRYTDKELDDCPACKDNRWQGQMLMAGLPIDTPSYFTSKQKEMMR